MATNQKTAQQIATAIAGGCHIMASAQEHIMLGNNPSGNGAHSGLHSMNIAAGHYPNLTQIALSDTDARVDSIYSAEIRLNGSPDKGTKVSSFFPATMNWVAIRAAIEEAWRDGHIYKSNDIYASMRAKYGLGMVGQANINGQQIWIGSMQVGNAGSPIGTAFPAVNNKFT